MKLKFIVILVISLFILAGCTKNNSTNDSSLDQEALDTLKATYEKELRELKVEQVTKIDILTKQIAALKTELDTVSTAYTDLKQKSELLEIAVFGEKKDDSELFSDIQQDGKVYKVYTEGTDYLEDGIITVVEVLDQNGKTIWKNVWEGIDVSEVATHSPLTIIGERLYIVVDGTLNAIDKETGEILWDSVPVGFSFQPPVVGNDGTIYTIGQYAPYFTAVSSEGDIKWQMITDDMYGIDRMGICNDYLVVNQGGTLLLFDKEGNELLEDNDAQ